MNSNSFPADEEYDRQCGDIFLTLNGELIIHCTLCETRYKSFQDYADHIIDAHYYPFETKELGNSSDDDDYILPKLEEVNLKMKDNHGGDVKSRKKLNPEVFLKEVDSMEIKKEVEEEGQMDTSTKVSNGFQDKFLESQQSEIEIKEDVKEEEQMNIPTKVSNGFQDEFLNTQKPETKEIEQTKKYRFMSSKRGRPKKYEIGKKERKHQCPHCNYSCSERSNLIGHMHRHSDKKPHQCNHCPKAFYTRTELNTHIFSHTGERPFLCPDCGQGFTTSSKLNAHRKRHTNQRDRECNLCDMKFFDLNSLKKHLSVHSEERPFKCKMCPNKFKLHASLMSHIKSHINAKEYRCDICSQRFNQRCNLNSHRKIKHGLSISRDITSINVE